MRHRVFSIVHKVTRNHNATQ